MVSEVEYILLKIQYIQKYVVEIRKAALLKLKSDGIESDYICGGVLINKETIITGEQKTDIKILNLNSNSKY